MSSKTKACRYVFLRRAAVLVFVCAALAGCGPGVEDYDPERPPKPIVPDPIKPAEPAKPAEPISLLPDKTRPLQDAECRAFAEKLVEAAVTGNAAQRAACFDFADVVRRASVGLEVPEDVPAVMMRITQDSTTGGRLFANIPAQIKHGGEFRLLRLMDRAGGKSAIVRSVDPANSIDYYEFPLRRREDGQIVAVDFRQYSGYLMSRQMRRVMIRVAHEIKLGPIKSTDGKPIESINELNDLEEMKQAWETSRPDVALSIYRRLRPPHVKSKEVLVQRMQIARVVGHAEYLAAVHDLRKTFPDDASAFLMSVDEHTVRGDYDGAIKTIDRLDKMIGGDPYLNTVRSRIHLLANDHASAKKAAQSAIAGGDRRDTPLLTLLDVSLHERAHQETLQLLKRLVIEHKRVLNEIERNPKFAAFVASSHYSEWQKYATVQSTPSDEEAEKFVAQLENAVHTGDETAANALIDWGGMIHRAAMRFDLTEDERRRHRDWALWSMSTVMPMMIEYFKQGAVYRCLGIQDREGRKIAVFRLATKNGADNYHEFSLVRLGTGQVVASDLFSFTTGEAMSDTIARGIVLFLTASDGSNAERFGAEYREVVRHTNVFSQIEKEMNAGQFAMAIARLKRLPAALQRKRFVLVDRYICAAQLGLSELAAAAQALQQEFDGEPWCDWHLSIAYAELKEFDKALDYIERVSRAIGHDPYLETRSARILLSKGEVDAAREVARKAIAGGDERMEPYVVLVGASLRQKKHDETLQTLGAIADRFGIVLDDLEANENYGEFVKTPQYRQWQEFVREQRAKAPPDSAPAPIPGRSFGEPMLK